MYLDVCCVLLLLLLHHSIYFSSVVAIVVVAGSRRKSIAIVFRLQVSFWLPSTRQCTLSTRYM